MQVSISEKDIFEILIQNDLNGWQAEIDSISDKLENATEEVQLKTAPLLETLQAQYGAGVALQEEIHDMSLEEWPILKAQSQITWRDLKESFASTLKEWRIE